MSSYRVSGSWKINSGGYMSSNNPQVEIIIKKQFNLKFYLQSPQGGAKMGLFFALSREEGNRKSLLEKAKIVKKSPFYLVSAVSTNCSVFPGRYVATLCLQKSNTKGDFTFIVGHTKSGVNEKLDNIVESIKLLKPSFTKTFSGNWNTLKGGNMSLQNPQYYLKISKRTEINMTLSDGDDDANRIFIVKGIKPSKRRLNMNEDLDVICKSRYLCTKNLHFTTTLDPKLHGNDYVITVCGDVVNIPYSFTLEADEENANGIQSFTELHDNYIKKQEDYCWDIIKKYKKDDSPFLTQNPITEIESLCKKKNAVFRDWKFGPSEESLHKGGTQKFENVQWKRLERCLDAPKLYIDQPSYNDIDQGSLGDCWLVQCLSVLSLKPSRIKEMIFPNSFSKYGVYVVKLWNSKEKKFEYIIVDDYIPLNEDGDIKFVKSLNVDEFWPFLIEKAFAKLFGSYALLHGGSPCKAMSILTGGFVEECDHDPEGANKIEIWNKMKEYHSKNWLMSCLSRRTSQPGRKGQRAAEYEKQGIATGHAYSIVKVIEVEGNKLICVRNPWADETEWKGRFSDSSSLWTNSLKQVVGFQDKNDGMFYMEIDHYVKAFSCTDFCKINDDTRKFAKCVKGDWKTEFGSTWKTEALNPKYVLKVTQPNTFVILTLIRNSPNLVVNSNSLKLHLIEKGYEFTDGNAIPKEKICASGYFSYSKTITCHKVLNEGTYHVVPEITKKTNESFLLWAQSDKPIEFNGDKFEFPKKEIIKPQPNPKPYVYTIYDWWTCKGYLRTDNVKFHITVKEKTTLTIDFRRTDKKINLGQILTICKPNSVFPNGWIEEKHKLISSKYILSKNTLFSVTLSPFPQPYILVPSLQQKLAGASFWVQIKSDKPIVFQKV